MMNQSTRSSNRPVWMFMVATAMATTVSTLAATAMVEAQAQDQAQAQAAQPVAVTCDCKAPAPAPEPACEGAPADQAAEVALAPAAPESAPVARQASMELEGQFDKNIIRRIVRAHIGEVRYCYNEGLQEDPELAGRVEVQFTIGTDGSVAESTVASTDIDDSGVPECIANAVARWKFPKPADGNKVTVTYPFVLEPG